MQSSLSNWLQKPAPQPKQPNMHTPTLPPPPPPPTPLSNPKRPPPPSKSVSAPTRVSSAPVPGMSNMDNWNDIPDDFLQASSRPKVKRNPRSSLATTPATPTALSRAPSPVSLAVQQPSMPQLFALRPLPHNVQLAPLTEQYLPDFKKLNALTLPIPYPESFYKETMTEPHLGITLVALWHATPTWDAASPAEKPQLVGAVRCRILPDAQLYISTIGILAPYRSHGIAMHLLQTIVRKAVDLHGVRCVTAHVWEANDEGLEWYKKRNFEILGKEDGYYRKLRPQGAFLVRKWIGVADLLPNNVVKDGQGTTR